MVSIKWTIQAKNDLKNIADYISNDSIQYAKFTNCEDYISDKDFKKVPKDRQNGSGS